jgi:uncharacterized cupredoxin-like copper-binding protein
MALLMAPLLLLTACGDDGGSESADATTTTVGGGGGGDEGEDSEYCTLSREMDEQEEFPSEEQLNALAAAAPDEIADDVQFVVDAFIEAGEENIFEVFSDPEVEERLEPIEAYDAEVCGIESEDEELPEGVSREEDAAATQVEVTPVETGTGDAKTYGWDFEAPSAGNVSFVMNNTGEEAHFIGVGKLAEGVTFEEALASEDTSETLTLEADSDVAAPGDTVYLTFENLEPGEYGMICFIPAPDGTPHALKGMAEPFTVS